MTSMSAPMKQLESPGQVLHYHNNAVVGERTSGIPDQNCRYPSKRCDNPRVVKRNGELHRFCKFHCAKANWNQRTLEHRRKMEHMAQQLPFEEYKTYISEQYKLLDHQHHIAKCDELSRSDVPVQLDLDEDDLRVLAEVLCVNDGNDLL